ncbi:MFS transporter [Breznakiella homolactica]|uniref:MFS transporter n=2 Tax=Breznakiella homolactica TaxID=2798577 RepID=A0A7T7XRX8_9SPIR|nr:MFS transporter [Breznakiella homolactica]
MRDFFHPTGPPDLVTPCFFAVELPMALVVCFFSAFLVYATIVPYLPVLVRGLGYSHTITGILLGIFEAAGIFGPFLFGYFADKLGRYKSGLIMTYGIVFAAVIPLALFRNPWISALSLVFLAIGFRSSVPLLDAAATIRLGSTGDYGRVRMAGSVSFVLLMLILQWTPVLKPDTSGSIAVWICISTVIALVSMAFLPAAQGTPEKPPSNTGPSGSAAPGKHRLWTSFFTLGIIMIAFGRLAMAPINAFFSLYLIEVIHWDAVGLMWALSALSEIPAMFFSSRLIRRFGAPFLLALSVVGVGARLAIYVLFPTKLGISVAQLLHFFCFGLFHPAAVAFVAMCVPPERRALGMSIYLSIGTGLPSFLGNAIGGYVVEHWGYPALFSSFIIFAVLSLLMYGVMRFFSGPVSSKSPKRR